MHSDLYKYNHARAGTEGLILITVIGAFVLFIMVLSVLAG